MRSDITLGPALLRELEHAVQEVAKEMLGEAIVREQVRAVVRQKLQVMLDELATLMTESHEAEERTAKKKGR